MIQLLCRRFQPAQTLLSHRNPPYYALQTFSSSDNKGSRSFQAASRQELLKKIPWQIGNRSELPLPTKQKVQDQTLMDKHIKMLETNHNWIVDGIQMSLRLFHDSLVNQDLSAIKRITEGNLAQACKSSFELLDQENCKLVAREVAEVSTEVELIDFFQVMGADIDRATNKQKGVWMFYDPETQHEAKHSLNFAPSEQSPFTVTPVLLQLLLRVETNLSIDLVDAETQERYLGDKDIDQKEVHFMLIEGKYDEIGPKDLTRLVERVMEIQDNSHKADVEDWTIVDFDSVLKGNPHTLFKRPQNIKN